MAKARPEKILPMPLAFTMNLSRKEEQRVTVGGTAAKRKERVEAAPHHSGGEVEVERLTKVDIKIKGWKKLTLSHWSVLLESALTIFRGLCAKRVSCSEQQLM